MSRLFKSGGPSIEASASASVLTMLISFRTDWFDLLAVQSPMDSQESSPSTTVQSISSSVLSLYRV